MILFCKFLLTKKTFSNSHSVLFPYFVFGDDIEFSTVQFDKMFAVIFVQFVFNNYYVLFVLQGGPWAPFENSWHLKKEYKSNYKRKELAD